MVALYVGGERVGTLADAERLIPRYLAERVEVEMREDDGRAVGKFVPAAVEPICPWEPDLTPAEIRRRIEEPGGSTLDEFWKRMGVR